MHPSPSARQFRLLLNDLPTSALRRMFRLNRRPRLTTPSPVCRVMMPSGLEAWLVTRYADVCTVFRDPRFFRQEAVRVGAAQVKGSGFELNPDLIQNTDGKRHSRLRAAFSSYYSIEHS